MSQPSREDALETERASIIENLTSAQEDILQEIHAQDYTGLDDEMPDAFEAWLEDLSVDDLKDYLS